MLRGHHREQAGDAEVAAVLDRNPADPVLPGLVNGHGHGPVGGQVAHGAVPVDIGGRPFFPDHLEVQLGPDVVHLQPLDVNGQPHHPVGGDSAQIGPDQQIGDNLGFLGRNPDRPVGLGAETAQRLKVYFPNGGFRHLFSPLII